MNNYYDPKEAASVANARESFSGRLLTDGQFDDVMSITGIIKRGINRSGKFKEQIADFAHAFARTQKFDAVKAETIIRDLFRERTGMTMNQMRETLMKREEGLSGDQKHSALDHAKEVGQMIERGDKISFHRAYAHQATILATDLSITDAGAKTLMKEEFKRVEGKEFYDWGKDVEKQFYTPQIEAEKQQRKDARVQENADSPQRSRAYSR